MLYPSIDSLLTIIDSKYSLVSVAAKRARNLQENGGGGYKLTKYVSYKNVGKSLEEIYAGKLHFTKAPQQDDSSSK